MGNPTTERKVKHLLSTEFTDDTFHPLNGEWVMCSNENLAGFNSDDVALSTA